MFLISFLVALCRIRFLLSVDNLTVANLARLGISGHCYVLVRCQYLVRLLSLYWIADGHTIHPRIEGLLPSTCIEPTPFRNSASKVAGLQVHATAPGINDFIQCVIFSSLSITILFCSFLCCFI